MSQTLNMPCPLCGCAPMQLLWNPHGEQYYRCRQPKCYGSRDAEGSSFREVGTGIDGLRKFERIASSGRRDTIEREETVPSRLDPIPGQPGLFRAPSDPNWIIHVHDYFTHNGRPHRGRWRASIGYVDFADIRNPNSVASQLEVLFRDVAAEPQRTIARMFAIVEHRELPRIAVNSEPPVASKASASTELPTETKMSEAPKTTKSKIVDQGKDIGSAMLDGLAEATVEEAGDILLDMAKELFEGEALLTIFLATPDGRELTKGLMALVIDSVAVHTSIPKAGALRKLARYQFRSSARRVGGPRIKKVMKRFSKLVELSERLPELPEGAENVVDFATAATAKAAR